MTSAQLATERARSGDEIASPPGDPGAPRGRRFLLVAAWTAIVLPLAWGVWVTLSKSLSLFR